MCGRSRLQEVRDTLLKQTFNAGAKVVYTHAADRRADGTFVPPFSDGTVTGPSSSNSPGCVNVEFDGDITCGSKHEHIAVAKIKLHDAAVWSPQVAAPHWWLCPGMPVKYVGKSESFKSGDSISNGHLGFILGPHINDENRVVVWMPNVANVGVYPHNLELPPGDGSTKRAMALSVRTGVPLCERLHVLYSQHRTASRTAASALTAARTIHSPLLWCQAWGIWLRVRHHRAQIRAANGWPFCKQAIRGVRDVSGGSDLETSR